MQTPHHHLVDGYRLSQRRRHLAASHTKDTARALVRFHQGIAPFAPGDVPAEVVEAWLDTLSLGASARYNWLSRLRCYYRWLNDHGHVEHDPIKLIDLPKLPRRMPRPIGDEDLRDALEKSTGNIRAWVVLGAYAGLRCIEMATLLGSNYDPHLRMLHVTGKGGHERMIPAHELVHQVLLPHTRSGPVFRQLVTGAAFSAQQVSSTLWSWLHRAGINASAHQLRHWFGTKTYEACRDIRVVQELMGHASPNTTARYAAWSRVTAREAVSALEVPMVETLASELDRVSMTSQIRRLIDAMDNHELEGLLTYLQVPSVASSN